MGYKKGTKGVQKGYKTDFCRCIFRKNTTHLFLQAANKGVNLQTLNTKKYGNYKIFPPVRR